MKWVPRASNKTARQNPRVIAWGGAGPWGWALRFVGLARRSILSPPIVLLSNDVFLILSLEIMASENPLS